ncbi:phenylacetate-CoA ligase [Allocatelliglobosispora scoriae]|uniref:Phenylacetate-CoA ligase n=1 Tax=Allocatelliglobosispora scoriae TaxID=643052 RepID=A0A841BZS3_9ACTN|nr:AMP-binding protein [Allocatelliglobosispora scoriae]MBB5873634.1 phenylacetate-CoA ligase [Allocatelliglobosispora scoriae]
MSEAKPLGEWGDADEIRAIQEKQLPQVFAWAQRSPFYQARLRGGETLRDLAPTTKQDLRDAYPFGLLAVEKSRLATYHESSGTAGAATASYYTEEDWVDLAERYARKWIPIGPEDTFFVRTPYALMITGHLAHRAARSHGATVVPGDNRSLAMPYSRVVRLLHDLEVSITWSLPTETLIWAEAARHAGWRPERDFPALRAFYVGGEPLTAARRARISEVWGGVPVVEEFGSTETGSLAGECPHGQMHFWADRAIPEVLDPQTGEISAEGAGHLIVTPLFREAMPLLRYNLEDNVELSYAPCACGWSLPTIRVLGRAAFGYSVGTARINQHDTEELVFGLPLEYGVAFWRGRALPDRLRIEIEVTAEHRQAACAALAEAVQARFGAPCEVTGIDPGGLLPHRVLTASQDVLKPRSLFGPDEDWDKAIIYG